MANLYPVFLKIENKPCVVVGGGKIALRKVLSILECRGKIEVISPELCSGLKNLVESGRIKWREKCFEKGDLKGVFLAVAATDDAAANREVLEECREKGIPVNVVDDPESSDFFLPSVVRRGSLVLAVSTCGRSPALASRIRKELGALYGPEYGALVDLLGEMRKELLEKGTPEKERRERLVELAHKNLQELTVEIMRLQRRKGE